ncbi:MAG: hypothetical protein ACYTFG_03540 [Planctomycetota bacterium]|jgi:hypothetical protein
MRNAILTLCVPLLAAACTSCTKMLIPEKIPTGKDPKIGLASFGPFKSSDPIRVQGADGSEEGVSEGMMVNMEVDFGVWNRYLAAQLALNLKIRNCVIREDAAKVVKIEYASIEMDKAEDHKTDVARIDVRVEVGEWKEEFHAEARENGPHSALGIATENAFLEIMRAPMFRKAIGIRH